MSKILSQEEIDSLLSSVGRLDRESGAAAAQRDGVIAYNFRRPDRISKEQIRSLHFLHDRFAQNVATSLSAYLRTVTDISLLSVEQFTYSEFLMSLPDPTAYYAVSMQPLEGMAGLELNPNVGFTMIDRMLGGSGFNASVNRAFTEIEQNVTDAVVKLVLENLTDTWRPIADIEFRIHGRETRPQMLQVAAPNEVVVLLSFDIRIGDARGMLNLCFPASSIEALGHRFTRTWQRTYRAATLDERKALLAALAKVPVAVTATMATTMTAREVLHLGAGDVISLGRRLTEPLDVEVSGISKFRGHPRRVGDTMCLMLESAGPAATRGDEGRDG